MEREHLIIIALILVALYMMNNSSSTDKVTGMGPAVGPMGRIRYTDCDPLGAPGSNPCAPPIGGHIRTRREGFMPVDKYNQDGMNVEASYGGDRIRLSNTYFGGSQHIKNHIRSRNTSNVFSGLMRGDCDKERFRFTVCEPGSDPRDCA
jgi:hypothetical protein